MDATPEQLAIGYFANIEIVKKTLETIYQALSLDDATFWRRQVKKLFKKKENDVKTKSKNKTKGAKKDDENDDEEKSTNEDEATSPSTGKKLKKSEKSKKSDKSNASTKVKQPRSNDDDNNPKPAKIKKSEPEEDDDDDDDDEAVHESTVDDFFITAEGTSYLSNAVVKAVKSGEENDEQVSRAPAQNGKRNQSFTKLNQNDNTRFAAKKPFKRNFEETVKEMPSAPVTPVDPNLHPSWLAKQKQKPIIAGFQGTKITFD